MTLTSTEGFELPGTYTIDGKIVKMELLTFGKPVHVEIKVEKLTDDELITTDIRDGKVIGKSHYHRKK